MNPYDNGCSCVEHGLYNTTDYPINDQRIYDQGRVRIDSAPWESDDLILGAPVARIRAKFSETRGNLVVRLQDVSPDGISTVITTGWLNVQHRLGHQKIAEILPETVYTFRVELWPTHWRLRTGHILRITISSGDIQHIEPTAPAGSTVTVLGGDDGSTIDLPIPREGPTPPVHYGSDGSSAEATDHDRQQEADDQSEADEVRKRAGHGPQRDPARRAATL